MTGFKILIDTNVIIGLEDAVPVRASLSDLVRLSGEHSVGLFVDGANYDDVLRDKNVARRSVTLSKLAKFQQLRGVPIPENTKLVARFGAINSENDRSDVRLLAAIDAKAVDFLVTQDIKLHRRAERAGIGATVLTVEDAVQWLKQTFTAKPVSLPYVVERKAYEIGQDHPILASLRADYPDFDRWFDKCRKEHRYCWTLEIAGELAGLVIRNDEKHTDAKTRHPGPNILKICTFKVSDEFQGEKFGELLLKQALWFAQPNKYYLIYLTAFPKHAFLIDLLSYYGFKETMKRPNDEIVLEKPILTGALPDLAGPPFEFDREWYPRYCDTPAVGKFCVPIPLVASDSHSTRYFIPLRDYEDCGCVGRAPDPAPRARLDFLGLIKTLLAGVWHGAFQSWKTARVHRRSQITQGCRALSQYKYREKGCKRP